MLLNFTKKLSADFLKEFNRPLLTYHPFVRGISRLNYKPDFFRHALHSKSIKEVLADPARPISWEDCCYNKAMEIPKNSSGPLYFSWSGGIDSTTAIISALKYWKQSDLDRITILMNKSSLEENHEFYFKYLSKFPVLSCFNDISNRLVKENALMITGELGDQLLGSDLLESSYESFGEEAIIGDYKTMMPKILSAIFSNEKVADAIFSRFLPIVQESPISIKSNHDFLWWFNYTQKWQHVKFRFLELENWNLMARYGSHVSHFFDSIDFEKWSLNNHDKKIKRDWKSYKFHAREFIFDFTKNPADLNLVKIQSLKNTYLINRRRIAITEDYREVTSMAELKGYFRYDC